MQTRAEATAQLTRDGEQFELDQVHDGHCVVRRYRRAPTTLRSVLKASSAYDERVALVHGAMRFSYRDQVWRWRASRNGS